MRQVAVGGAGVWGVAKDNSLWFRGVAGRTDSSVGENWTKMQSAPLKLISVGPNSVWGLDMDNHCVVRTEVGQQLLEKEQVLLFLFFFNILYCHSIFLIFSIKIFYWDSE